MMTFFKTHRSFKRLLILTVLVAIYANTGQQTIRAGLNDFMVAESWQISLKTQHPSKPWPWANVWPTARLYSDELKQEFYLLQKTRSLQNIQSAASNTCAEQKLLKLQQLFNSRDLELQTMDGRWHRLADAPHLLSANSQGLTAMTGSPVCYGANSFAFENNVKKLLRPATLRSTLKPSLI